VEPEPVGKDAILGHAIEHAVGPDDGRVHRAREDEEAHDDDESAQHEPDPQRSHDVHREAADQVVAVNAHAHVVRNDEGGEPA
jgi:hypothetical protein